MKLLLRLTAVTALLFSTTSMAHHSFSPYAINDPMEISGVVESFRYVRPHPILELQENDGRLWTIEITPRNWSNTGLEESSDVIQSGDELRARLWPARNGSPEAVLSGFELKGEYYEITAQIRQRSAVEEADRLDGDQE